MSSQTSTTIKKVRFSDAPPVIHKSKRYRNPEDLYYSGAELAEMAELARVSVYFSDRELKQMNVDLRGLEPSSVSRMDDQKMEFVKDFLRLQRKLLVRKSSFQERQDSLKSFIRSRSKNCEKEALKMAKKDEAEAKRIYKAANITWARTDSGESSMTTTSVSSKTKSFLGSLVKGIKPTLESSVLGRAA